MATTPATLLRALAQRRPGTPVLIDTPGINPFDAGDVALLRGLVEACGAVPVLAVQAGLDPVEAEDQAAAFAAMGARHLLATRLDLARRLGAVLAAAARADLILTEAGVGTGATDGLAPLTADFLAERLRASVAAAWRSENLSAAMAGHMAGAGQMAVTQPGRDGAAAIAASIGPALALPAGASPLAWADQTDETAGQASVPDGAAAAAGAHDAAPSSRAQGKVGMIGLGQAAVASVEDAEGDATLPATSQMGQSVVWTSQSGAQAPPGAAPPPLSMAAPPDAMRAEQFPRRVTTPWTPRRLTPAERARAIAPASDR